MTREELVDWLHECPFEEWFIMDDDGSGTCKVCFVLDEETDDD